MSDHLGDIVAPQEDPELAARRIYEASLAMASVAVSLPPEIDAHAQLKEVLQSLRGEIQANTGLCPVCGKRYHLTGAGVMRKHGIPTPQTPCEGSGRSPRPWK
jgi:hypothetical protein